MAAFLCYSRLDCPLQEPEETRYAEISRQMLNAGNWVVPEVHGQPYYDKPPLLYWLVMISYKFFGVRDEAARLAPSTAAFLCILVTYFWGASTVNRRAALVGALMLCLSARPLQMGRMVTMNSLLAFWVVSALASAHHALLGTKLRWGWWLLSACACGLGLLTKGPVALVLIVAPLFAFQMLDRRVAQIRWGGWTIYLLVSCGLALPWYIALLWHDPSFAGYFFWTHHVRRFVAPIDHAQPLWYYLPVLILGMLPWTLLVPGLLKFLCARSLTTARRRPAGLGLFLLAALWCLAFLSAAGCKRAGYILPAMPALALALGCYLDAILPEQRTRLAQAMLWRHPAALAYYATLLATSAGSIVCLLGIFADLVPLALGLVLASMFALVLVGLLICRHSRTLPWAVCGLASFVLLAVTVQELLPAYAHSYSLRDQVVPHLLRTPSESMGVVCYPHRWDSVSYYLRNNSVKAYHPEQLASLIDDLRTHPSTLVFVKSDHSLPDLLLALPRTLEFVPCQQTAWVTSGWIRRRAAFE